MKAKFVFSAFCMLVAMTMATGAFAQATFQVSSGASQGRLNGHTEEAGGITLVWTSGSIPDKDDPGTVVIDYGVPITNEVGKGGTAINVNICGKQLDETDAETETEIDGNTITVTASSACTDNKSSIDVSGVRLSLAGRGLDSVTATVGSTGSVRLLGGSQTLTVINSIKDELTDDGIDVDKKVTLIRHTGKVTAKGPTKFKLFIKENTVSSFDNAQLKLEFSGIPDGVEVTLDAWVIAAANLAKLNTTALSDDADDKNEKNSQLAINNAKNLEAVVTAEDNDAIVLTGMLMLEDKTGKVLTNLKGGELTTGRDVVIVMGTIGGATDKDLLPLDLDIQVTVDVGPIGVVNPKGAIKSIPRFASDKTTAVTVIDSTSAQSEMTVGFILSEGAYDTGIAVSNMTKAEGGALHFAFFTNGQELKYSTPDMVGPRSTMRVLLSELLTAAEHTGSFSGYMTITADFTKADAGVFISDFAGFTSAVTVTQD